MKKVLAFLSIGMIVLSMFLMLSTVRAHSGTFPRIENWRPGDAHIHSVYSTDGSDSVGDIVQDAKDSGLEWIIITDHSYDMEWEGWWDESLECLDGEIATGLTVLCGEELSVDEKEGDGLSGDTGHYLCYGLNSFIENSGGFWMWPDEPNAQDAIDNINGQDNSVGNGQENAVGFIAHPFAWAWDWSDLDSVTGYTGIEVWNGETDGEEPDDETMQKWDELLVEGLTSGRHVVGIGNSDAHPGRSTPSPYEHSVFTFLNLPSLTRDAIIDAYRGGHAIFSNGPLLTFKIGQKEIGDTAYVNRGSSVTLNIEWAIPDFAAMQTVRINKITASDCYWYDISISGTTGSESWTDPNPINVPCYYRLEGFSADEEFRVYTNPIWIQPIDRSWGKSNNVAVVDDYYGSAVGYLYPSDYPDQTFSALSASQVSAESLANYDTVVLYMFNPSLLTSVQKAAVNNWIYRGGKLIIWDSDQVPPSSPWDYTWLPYPFTTSVPGQTGQVGEGLDILEENQLSSSDPSSPYYIDTVALNSQTDAVGDANVLISYSPGWHIDMMATNVLGETGPAHVYAAYGSGLVIYSAFDWDYAGYSQSSGQWLIKMLEQEFECSALPFAAPSVPAEVGLTVEITSDRGSYEVNDEIQFTVTVTNPTDATGINVVAYNSWFTAVPPEEIETLAVCYLLGDIAPGESKTASFEATAKKAGVNVEVIVNAYGEDHLLDTTIGGSGKVTFSIREPEAQRPDWSFAVITDLHVGFDNEVEDWDSDGKLEIDYDGRTWDDSGSGDGYYITENLVHAVQRIVDEKDDYNIRFVVALGDISDTAEKSEFLKAKEILSRLNDPNRDGNTEDGIPYVPLLGNHDTWPYTQDGSDPHERAAHDTIASYAKGDQFFQEIFWDQNPTNTKLVLKTLKEWKKQPMPVYSWVLGHNIYFQNYAFSYWEAADQADRINFLGLDLCTRLWMPGAPLGGVADYHAQTKEFLEEYLKGHQGQTVMVFTHNPLLGIGGFLRPSRITGVISKYNCKGYNFGGHTHRNHVAILDNVPIIETESVSQIELLFPGTEYPLSTRSGESIRIVQIKNGVIDYSTTLKPSSESAAIWPSPFFTYTYASYPEPNTEMVFTAHFTTYHGFKTSFDWNFGDQTPGSGSSAKHTYALEGQYAVTLKVTTRNLVTGGEKSQTAVGYVYVHDKHVISHLPSGLNAVSLFTGEDLTQVPKNTYQPTLIAQSSSGIPIAELGVHFEEATEDIDLATLVVDVDLEQGKSLVYMPMWPEEVDQYKQLYIPSTGTGIVYICLEAASLDDVSLENADLILDVGETQDGITVTTIFYNGREYYLVFGVTGTGGGETTSVWVGGQSIPIQPPTSWASSQLYLLTVILLASVFASAKRRMRRRRSSRP